jgi:hypothetical protein
MSMNPNATHLFATLEYEQMKETNELFRLELLQYVFEPDRLMRISKGSIREYLKKIG